MPFPLQDILNLWRWYPSTLRVPLPYPKKDLPPSHRGPTLHCRQKPHMITEASVLRIADHHPPPSITFQGRHTGQPEIIGVTHQDLC